MRTGKINNRMKAILEILRKHPDGIGVNELFERLKDNKGRHLMSKPTLIKELDRLKNAGLIQEEGEWRLGQKKTIKLRNSHRIIAEKLSEIRAYRECFQKIANFILRDLKSESVAETDAKLKVITGVAVEKLNRKIDEFLNSDISEEFKKELIFEVLELEKEIKKEYFDIITENKSLYDFWTEELKEIEDELLKLGKELFKERLETLSKTGWFWLLPTSDVEGLKAVKSKFEDCLKEV